VLLWSAAAAQGADGARERPTLAVDTTMSSAQGLAFAADPTLGVVWGREELRVQDLSTGRVLRTLRVTPSLLALEAAHERGVAVGMVGDLRGGPQELRRWDLASGEATRVVREETPATADRWVPAVLAITPDASRIALCTYGGGVRVYDGGSGQLVRAVKLDGSVPLPFSVALSRDGRLVAAAALYGGTEVFDVETGERRLQLASPRAVLRTLAFSPDGRELVDYGIGTQRVVVWDLASGKVARSVDLAHKAVRLAVRRDAAVGVASGLQGQEVLDLAAGAARAWIDTPGGAVLDPAGERMLVGELSGAISLWDAHTWTRLRVFPPGGAVPVRAVRFLRDGRLVTAHADVSVRTWATDADRAPDHNEFPFREAAPADVAGLGSVSVRPRALSLISESPRGGLVALGATDGTIRIWNPATNRVEDELNLPDSIREWELKPIPEDPSKGKFVDGLTALAWGPAWLATSLGNHQIGLFPTGEGARRYLWACWGNRDVGSGAPLYPTHLDFSADGRWLAATLNDTDTACVWDLTSKDELDEGIAPRWARAHGPVVFSPDSRYLALQGEKGLELLEPAAYPYSSTAMTERARACPIPESIGGGVGELAFSPDGGTLAGALGSAGVLLWDLSAPGCAMRALRGRAVGTGSIAFSPDGKYLAASGADGVTDVWDVRTGEPLLALLTAKGGAWVAVTPDGLFDGSPDGFGLLLWRFGEGLRDVAPAEAFFSEYYHPGLVSEIFRGERPRAAVRIEEKDRRLPALALRVEGAPGAAVTARTVKVRVEVREAPADAAHAAGGGVRDVRLFRNGTLVRAWRGELAPGPDGSLALEAEVSVQAGENRLSAYAFNRDNVKSEDAATTVQGATALARKGTAWIVTIGVDRYANRGFDLRFAAADAREFDLRVTAALQRTGRFARVEHVRLQDARATREAILAALRRLEGAQPEDAVLLFFSGHGIADGKRFVLLPHDLGYGGPRSALDEAAVAAMVSHGVSDADLEAAFDRVGAGEILLVVDACNSGQALEAEERRRGPMNSHGLAQLAWEKGMFVLTAAQADQEALETARLGHGLLTYALVSEGLVARKAFPAGDGARVLTARAWLDYAAGRVPTLDVSRTGGRGFARVEPDEGRRRVLQQPRVFYRREVEGRPFIVGR
jgi:WD40 repeat protein